MIIVYRALTCVIVWVIKVYRALTYEHIPLLEEYQVHRSAKSKIILDENVHIDYVA